MFVAVLGCCACVLQHSCGGAATWGRCYRGGNEKRGRVRRPFTFHISLLTTIVGAKIALYCAIMPHHPHRVAVILGTRPEAIKLAPVIQQLTEDPAFEPLVICTAQHRGLMDQVLQLFEIEPDYDLDLMTPDQKLEDMASNALRELTVLLRRETPDLAVVQGDTTTAMMGAMAAHYVRCPVAHVEAGLRSFDKANPFPEEMNRRIVSQLADLHFAPTDGNRDNLLAEGIRPDAIVVTGNSVIDALLKVADLVDEDRVRRMVPGYGTNGRKLVLVTVHRRESFGPPLEHICSGIKTLAQSGHELDILCPVHPNPNVKRVLHERLGDVEQIHLTAPLDYLDLVAALKYSTLVLTDSGGIQEEAPSLGKPVLVLREVTERPEGVEAGVVEVVGRDPEKIVSRATRLLEDRDAYLAMSRKANPYGDGKAAPRMVKAAAKFLEGWKEGR